MIQITIDTLILFDKEGRLYYHLSRIINLIRLFPPPKIFTLARAFNDISAFCTSFLCLRQHFSLCVCVLRLCCFIRSGVYTDIQQKYIINAGYCEIVSNYFQGESQESSMGFWIVSTGTRHWTDFGVLGVVDRLGLFNSFKMASSDENEKLSSSSSTSGTFSLGRSCSTLT